MLFGKERPEELELTYQHFFIFSMFLYFIYMLLGYALTDDQLMEVAEKSEVLDVDENYMGQEFACHCRNVISSPEELKDNENQGSLLAWSLFTIEK